MSVDQEPKPRAPSFRDVLRSLGREYGAYRRWLILIGCIGGAVAVAELGVVFLIAALASSLVSDKTGGLVGLSSLTPSLLAALAVTVVLFRGLVDLLQIRLQARATRDFDIRSRHELLSSYMLAGWDKQSEMDPGEVAGAFHRYLNSVRDAFGQYTQVPVQTISFLLMLVGSLVAGGLWSIGIILGSVLLAVIFQPLTRHTHRVASQNRMDGKALDSFVFDIPPTRLDSRVFGVDDQFIARMDAVSIESANTTAWVMTVKSRLGSLYTSAVYLVAVVGLGLVAILDVSGPARYAAVVILLYRGLGYARGLQTTYQALVAAVPTIDELHVQREALSTSRLRTGGDPLSAPVMTVQLTDACYAYPNGHMALTDATLALRRGEAVGIVGPSGAGKSTLAQLILGLRNPTAGAVTIDGVDLRGADMSTWFGHIAMVPQAPRALQGTIAENVRYLRDGISDEEVISALKTARLYDELISLPDGLDTAVGEFGVRLSGGQVQRLAVARALVGHPNLVVMDEPTSALDPITEEALRVGLEYLKERCILVIIAHRFSTLRLCDQIVVVEDGRIQAVGDRSMIESKNEFFAEAARLARLA